MSDDGRDPPRPWVVLVHGLASHRWFLRPLAGKLERDGFRTRLWGYPSIRRSIRDHAKALADGLASIGGPDDTIHLVTHSMGGIVARQALQEHSPGRLGRMVMLAPPNHGSHVAAIATRVLGRWCRTLAEITDRSDSLVRRLGEPADLDIGIIAARSDRVVRLDSTMLACQRDHIVLPAGHVPILFHRQTAPLVATFLREGRFGAAPRREPQLEREENVVS